MSSSVAALIAHASFWALLLCGWWLGELRVRASVTFVALWLAAGLCRPYVPHGADLFAPFVATLDIALVFAVFKGDVPLR